MLLSTYMLLPGALKSLAALLCSTICFATSNPKLLFLHLLGQCLLYFQSQPVSGALQATPPCSSSCLFPCLLEPSLLTLAENWGGSCTEGLCSPPGEEGQEMTVERGMEQSFLFLRRKQVVIHPEFV